MQPGVGVRSGKRLVPHTKRHRLGDFHQLRVTVSVRTVVPIRSEHARTITLKTLRWSMRVGRNGREREAGVPPVDE